MKTPFYSSWRQTQPFGADHFLTINGKKIKASDYYGQWGLAGHEGGDYVPITSNWTLLSLTDGVVVRDEDNPRSGAYGVYLTIWDKDNNRAFQYCHMEKNDYAVGDIVHKGDVIGRMGATGNVTGAHLHLNMFETDDNGVRLNPNNGYLGGIDPLPFLESDDSMQPIQDTQKKLDQMRKERDLNYNLFRQLTKPFGIDTENKEEDADKAEEEIRYLIAKEKELEEEISDIHMQNEKEINDIITQHERAIREISSQKESLLLQKNAVIKGWNDKYETLLTEYRQLEKEKRPTLLELIFEKFTGNDWTKR